VSLASASERERAWMASERSKQKSHRGRAWTASLRGGVASADGESGGAASTAGEHAQSDGAGTRLARTGSGERGGADGAASAAGERSWSDGVGARLARTGSAACEAARPAPKGDAAVRPRYGARRGARLGDVSVA
jgi:hypothetical protein